MVRRRVLTLLYVSVAPIPAATVTNREWGTIGTNYLKGLVALAFQGFFIEELEECNYNMIDNVLNNEKPKEEKQTGRISIKEKLAEKKAVIEQRDKSEKKAPEKGTEKKSEREI